MSQIYDKQNAFLSSRQAVNFQSQVAPYNTARSTRMSQGIIVYSSPTQHMHCVTNETCSKDLSVFRQMH